jgi:ParB-like chromosome segregation protein Spo0J
MSHIKHLKELARQQAEKAPDGQIKKLASGRSDLFRINPFLLNIEDGLNSRDLSAPENAAHVEALAASIAEVGVQEPLRIFNRDNKWWVSNGHCRLAGVFKAIERGAEIIDVPVIPEGRYASAADHVFRQLVSNSGKPLSSLEQAHVFKRLLGFGWTEKDIATKTGQSVVNVVRLLELSAAPESVKAMVASGEVSATVAHQVVKQHGGAAEAKLRDGLAVAQSSGKMKVTAKHLNGGTDGNSLQAVFSRATIERDDDVVIVAFSTEDFGWFVGKYRIVLPDES